MTEDNIIEVTGETGLQVDPKKSEVSTLSTFTQQPEASQQIADKFMEFLRASLEQLTIWWKKAISEEQLATLTLVGIIIVSIPLLTIVIGVINIINNIPLFSSLLELIGLVYFIWFTYRYLLFADTRRELSLKTSTLKQRVIGK
jgi:CAAD domains of cyanobacterial aminoacyl-tRNA synthetase